MSRAAIERKAIICFCLAYISSTIWTKIAEPHNPHYYAFFPFNDMQLTFRTYVYFMCKILELSFIYYGVSIMMVKYRAVVVAIWCLYTLDFIDYVLIYGEPMFYLGPVPIEYGLLKGIAIIFLGTIVFLKQDYGD